MGVNFFLPLDPITCCTLALLIWSIFDFFLLHMDEIATLISINTSKHVLFVEAGVTKCSNIAKLWHVPLRVG